MIKADPSRHVHASRPPSGYAKLTPSVGASGESPLAVNTSVRSVNSTLFNCAVLVIFEVVVVAQKRDRELYFPGEVNLWFA
jgi:hypothetical protein